jgi:EAL domain-containing protein (putative c-di-GMP-specific phosphodiesterase class I)
MKRRVNELHSVVPLTNGAGNSSLERPVLERYFPHFQPLVYLPTGNIAGYELLARTHDKQDRVVSAGALFSDPELPVDFLIQVDRHLRQEGFRQFADQDDAGFLTINICPNWVSRLGNDVSSPTLRLLEQSNLDPKRVVIEITEASGDLDRLRQIVKQYHAAGLRVAIDDFGAGYSQLDRVIALHPDIIKLDMRLFKLAAKGGLSADVLLGMTTIAERSGCEVVCEGVETEEEFYFGVECGAQYMQGYLFAPALGTLLPGNTFQPRVRLLTEHYLNRKCESLDASIDHSTQIKRLIFELQAALQNGELNCQPTTELLGRLQSAGIMRYFLCDTSGYQISPNYEVAASALREDSKYRGYNWSWRPYFPTLIATRNRTGFDLVASTIYRDVNTAQLCKTFGLFLDNTRILLIDAAVRDEVLYAGS